MNRFCLVSFLLLVLSLPVHAAPRFAGSADNLEGTSPVIVSLSDIRQESMDVQPEDHYLVESVMEARTYGADQPGVSNVDQSAGQLGGITPSAPKLFRGFNGLGASGFEPADPNIAVGPDRVVAVVNRSIAIYTKLGQQIFQTTLRNFFRALPDTETVSILDPKVIYDAYNQHFIVIMETMRSTDKKSWYFMAVSKTSDPRDWAFWELNMALNGGATTQLFADFPGVGLDPQAIYLTGNMFNWDNHFQYAKIRVLKKSEVYKFGKVTWHDFFNMVDAAGVKAITIQPAQSFGTAPSELLVSANRAGGDKLTLWTITNPIQPGIALNKTAVSVSPFQPPPAASQKGGPLKIGTGDASLGNAVFRNGFIYTAHTVANGTVSAIRFYQISSTGAVAQQVNYGISGSFVYFPAVMVDSRNNVVIAFNRSSGGQFVSSYFTGRKSNAAPNTLEPSAALQAGLSYYHLTQRTVQFWGDYNGIALDYDDSIWMIAASAKKPDEWTTRIGKVSY